MKILYILLIIFGGTPNFGLASPLGEQGPMVNPPSNAILYAGRAVDEAWEAFHRAALGGTLVSPVVQGRIEQDLHQSRALLMKARKAADQSRLLEVERLAASITRITERIKRDSQREKL